MQIPTSETGNKASEIDDPFVLAFGKVDDSQIRVRKTGDSVHTDGDRVHTDGPDATHKDMKTSASEEKVLDPGGYNILYAKSETVVQETQLGGSGALHAADTLIRDDAAHLHATAHDTRADTVNVLRDNARQHMPVQDTGADDERGNQAAGAYASSPSNVNHVPRGQGHAFGSAPFAPTQSLLNTDPNTSEPRMSANSLATSALRSWPIFAQNPFTDNRGAFPVHRMVGFGGQSMQDFWSGGWAQSDTVAVDIADTGIHKQKIVASEEDEDYNEDQDDDSWSELPFEDDVAGWKEVCIHVCMHVCMHVRMYL